jgi:hypothetical protein
LKNKEKVKEEKSVMKKVLQLSLISLSMFLSSCAVLPLVGGPQVTGNLVGEWPEGTGLALVSLTSEGQVDYSNQQQIVDDNITDGYLFALPDPAAEGIYQIVGYQDTNQNSLFDEGETIGSTGSKYLIYATADKELNVLATPVVVRRGWNGYDLTATSTAEAPNPFQVDTYRDFDLFLN